MECYLVHHGTKGMKWGRRLYQHKDGSLTALGRLRYRKRTTNDEPEDDIETRKAKVLASRSAKELYKNADLFDDVELVKAYNRLNTERNILNLAPKEVSKGQQIVDKIVTAGNNASTMIDTGSKVYNNVAKVFNSVMGSNLPVIGEKKKGDSATAKLIKSGTATDIVNNFGKLSNDDLKNASTRFAYEDKIRNWADKESKNSNVKDTKSNKSASKEPSTSGTDSKSNVDEKTKKNKDVEPEVVGQGTSKYKPKPDIIIDVDVEDIPNDTVQRGETIVGYLLEDKRKK